MPNPVFSQKAIESEVVLDSEPMTINGAINKTFVLFALFGPRFAIEDRCMNSEYFGPWKLGSSEERNKTAE